MLRCDICDWEIEGVENIRPNISHVLTAQEAADWWFSEFQTPLHEAPYMVDRKCREVFGAFYDEDEL